MLFHVFLHQCRAKHIMGTGLVLSSIGPSACLHTCSLSAMNRFESKIGEIHKIQYSNVVLNWQRIGQDRGTALSGSYSQTQKALHLIWSVKVERNGPPAWPARGKNRRSIQLWEKVRKASAPFELASGCRLAAGELGAANNLKLHQAASLARTRSLDMHL